MSRSNEFSASSASGPPTRSRTHIPHSKDLCDDRTEQLQRNVSRLKSRHPLSAEDIDAQIRSYFARGLV